MTADAFTWPEDPRITAVEALVVSHEARDGRVPCSLLRVALGMPRRDRSAS